jgi:hypothetical protein
MPLVRDFRSATFKPVRIDRCGRYVGSKLYWKLYAIENTLRIVINSVLTQQIGPNWWSLAVDPRIVSKAVQIRANYVAKPKNAHPGIDDLHLIFLTDLTNILRDNSHQFLPVVTDTNNWIATLEALRMPRNLVGHMNFPNAFDKAAIDLAYSRLPSLVGQLTTNGVPILIPK